VWSFCFFDFFLIAIHCSHSDCTGFRPLFGLDQLFASLQQPYFLRSSEESKLFMTVSPSSNDDPTSPIMIVPPLFTRLHPSNHHLCLRWQAMIDETIRQVRQGRSIFTLTTHDELHRTNQTQLCDPDAEAMARGNLLYRGGTVRQILGLPDPRQPL
jgi:hypothetical protein